jgi:hypothetical protein
MSMPLCTVNSSLQHALVHSSDIFRIKKTNGPAAEFELAVNVIKPVSI